MTLKVEHSQCGDKLKFGRLVLHGIGEGTDLLRERSKLVIGDLLVVHLHTLVEAHDEGGGVETHAVARLLQNGGKHGGGGTLAVGAADVNELQLLMGIAQLLQKRKGTLKAGLAAHPAYTVDIGKRCFVSHNCYLSLYIK